MPVAATTAAAASTAVTTTTAAAARAFLARTSFVDRQCSPLEILLVKHRDRLGGVLLRAHLDEGKPARTPRRAVLHDIHRNYRPCLRKVVLQVIFRYCEGQVPDK